MFCEKIKNGKKEKTKAFKNTFFQEIIFQTMQDFLYVLSAGKNQVRKAL